MAVSVVRSTGGSKQQSSKLTKQQIGKDAGAMGLFAAVLFCCFAAFPIPSPMHFDLVDRILEQPPDRIVTLKHVTSAEEYLGDHFPSFPVLPGVMMLEAMVQAGRRMLEGRAGRPLVL